MMDRGTMETLVYLHEGPTLSGLCAGSTLECIVLEMAEVKSSSSLPNDAPRKEGTILISHLRKSLVCSEH